MSKNVVIVGGNSRIALTLTRLLRSQEPQHSVTSIVEHLDKEAIIRETGATPVHLTWEDSTIADFANVLKGKDVVYFTTGAGMDSPEEKHIMIDYEGALKVFDAIDAVQGTKPRLIMLSGVDVRDEERVPAHYTEADKKMTEDLRKWMPLYYKWKYEADKNLIKRDAFKWTILRAGGFLDTPGTGKAAIGRTCITEMIPRDDVAKAFYELLNRDDAAGLAIDIVGGETDIVQGLDVAIKKYETDFSG